MDKRDKEGGGLLQPQRAQLLITLVERSIKHHAEQGHAPTDEDLDVLEHLQAMAKSQSSTISLNEQSNMLDESM